MKTTFLIILGFISLTSYSQFTWGYSNMSGIDDYCNGPSDYYGKVKPYIPKETHVKLINSEQLTFKYNNIWHIVAYESEGLSPKEYSTKYQVDLIYSERYVFLYRFENGVWIKSSDSICVDFNDRKRGIKKYSVFYTINYGSNSYVKKLNNGSIVMFMETHEIEPKDKYYDNYYYYSNIIVLSPSKEYDGEFNVVRFTPQNKSTNRPEFKPDSTKIIDKGSLVDFGDLNGNVIRLEFNGDNVKLTSNLTYKQF